MIKAANTTSMEEATFYLEMSAQVPPNMKENKMKLVTVAAVVTLMATVCQVSADDQNFATYGEMDGWTVYVNVPEKSCFVESDDNDGKVVRMGLSENLLGLGYLAIFTQESIGIENGAIWPVELDIDGTRFSAEALGATDGRTGSYSGGYVYAKDATFISDLAEKNVLTVNPGTNAEFKVDLKGTMKAMELARHCSGVLSRF